jgi:hypothetical protein
MLDAMLAKVKAFMKAEKNQPPGAWPQWMRCRLRSTRMPHQGEKERARRVRQMKAYWSGGAGCKLGPENRGRPARSYR